MKLRCMLGICREIILNDPGIRGWPGSRYLVILSLMFSNDVILHLADAQKFHLFRLNNEQYIFSLFERVALC